MFFSCSDGKEDVLSRSRPIEGLEKVDNEDDLSSPSGHGLKGENVTYYQSLIDQRDCPYIVSFFIFGIYLHVCYLFQCMAALCNFYAFFLISESSC